MRGTLIVSLILSVLMVVFALLNNEDAVVNFGFATTEGPIALILILTFIVGVVVGMLAMIPSRYRAKQKVKALQKQLGSTQTPMQQEQPPTWTGETPDEARSNR